MKTVLNQLIEKLSARIESNENVSTTITGRNSAFYECMDLAKELLEVEKRQIVDAFNEGYRHGESLEDSQKPFGDISEFQDANNYFTETFEKTS